jgi:hypothetical protein
VAFSWSSNSLWSFPLTATTRLPPSWHIFTCHNAFRLFKNSHNTKTQVVAVSLMPQGVVVVFSAQWAFSIFELNTHTHTHTHTHTYIYIYIYIQKKFSNPVRTAQ